MLALSGGTALAGGFVGLGIGSEPRLEDDSGRFSSDGRSGRLMGGYSIPIAVGRISLEAAYTGFSIKRSSLPFDGSVLWAAGRYNFPMGSGFEVFGRLGAQHTSLTSSDNIYDTSGNGPLVGAGFEYHPPLKLSVDASVWVDLTYASTKLSGERLTTDTSDHFWTLGLSIGF